MIIRPGPKSEVVNVEENSHQYIMSYILDVLIPGGLSYGISEIPNMNHIRLDFMTLPKCSDKKRALLSKYFHKRKPSNMMSLFLKI